MTLSLLANVYELALELIPNSWLVGIARGALRLGINGKHINLMLSTLLYEVLELEDRNNTGTNTSISC